MITTTTYRGYTLDDHGYEVRVYYGSDRILGLVEMVPDTDTAKKNIDEWQEAK